MNKTNKIILFVLLACSGCIASSGSVEYGPSCSSEVPEIATPEESSSAPRDEALERVLDNHFPQFRFPKFKQELQAAQDAYHTAVPLAKRRNVMPALDKILFESGLIWFRYEFYKLRESQILSDLSRILRYDDFSDLIIERFRKNPSDFIIKQFTEDPHLDLSPKTTNIICESNENSYSVTFPFLPYDDPIREFCKEMDFLKNFKTYEIKFLSENKKAARKMISNPNLLIDRFPTLIKKLIEEYRVILNMDSALINDAKFESDDDINQSLSAYRSFKRALNSYEDAARLAASSKAINDTVIS